MGGLRLPARIGLLGGGLLAANVAAWMWAAAALHGSPALMATALLAYGFGLRHAVDADHIAAIDNVTRKLMQDGARPVTVGFWFAAGHSAVVLLAAALLATTAGALAGVDGLRRVGGVLSTVVSAGFLFAIAVSNLLILRDVRRAFRRVRRGEAPPDGDARLAGGPAGRRLRPLLRLVGRSWHMAPLGFLFGLGFDTATEVALLGLSASQGLHGAPLGVMLMFPALFAAGMSLVDSLDGVMMLGVYEWAFVKPVRKLYYNMTVTLVSALIALGVGGVETLALVGDRLGLRGGVWDLAAAAAAHFNLLGFAIIGVLALSWLVSAAVWRLRRYDDLSPSAA